MYKYYSRLGFIPIKHNEEVKEVHNEIFINIPHFIKICLCVNYLQYGFVMYNDKVLIHKQEVVPHINYSMIPLNCC